jgi:uncharacterized protein YodC (DUF2158 family)
MTAPSWSAAVLISSGVGVAIVVTGVGVGSGMVACGWIDVLGRKKSYGLWWPKSGKQEKCGAAFLRLSVRIGFRLSASVPSALNDRGGVS